LALAIVSARAAAHPAFPLASIADGLRHSRRRLDAFGTSGGITDARTAFSRSYLCLSPQARLFFRLLASWPAADVTTAVGTGLLGVGPDEARRLITELADASLLTEYRPGLYRCHALIRAYAAELSEGCDALPDRSGALLSGLTPAAS
jgi:hypothetical protein